MSKWARPDPVMQTRWGMVAGMTRPAMREPGALTTGPWEGWRFDSNWKWRVLSGSLPGGEGPSFVHTAGRRVAAVREDLGGGIFRYRHPEFGEVGTRMFGGDRARRKRILRKVRKFVTGPGVLGAITGFILPQVLSTALAVKAGLGITLAGYVAPQGSWVRRFSIGAGVGAASLGALHAIKPLTRFGKMALKLYMKTRLGPTTQADWLRAYAADPKAAGGGSFGLRELLEEAREHMRRR